MTSRELIMSLLLNSNLDDPVYIEVQVPENNQSKYLSFEPEFVSHIGPDDAETLIECKPYKGVID